MLNENSAITLIALVITVIVLLILAGVTIATLTGENGILNQAANAKQKTERAEVEEIVDIAMLEWETIKYREQMTFEEFLNSKVEKGDFDSVTNNGDGTYTVEKNGYKVIVNDEGRIGEAERVGEVLPELEANLYQTDGNDLAEDIVYENAILTVNIVNREQLGNIDEIKVTSSTGTVIRKESSVMGNGEASFGVVGLERYTIMVKATTNGIQKTSTITTIIKASPQAWKITNEDSQWYSYVDLKTQKSVKVAKPQLVGKMTPIKYIGEVQNGSKWANATTADGSMFVWIPRYAYKITEQDQANVEGKIEVAFINTSNQFLNGETGEITDNPSVEGAGIDKWLVHPAFTPNAANGGGFGQLAGLWVGKFETTGSTTELAVRPGVPSLRDMTINEQYQAGKLAKFGEIVTLKSHMMKNSEWGVTVYLAHSQYGTNGEPIERNMNSSYCTGGDSTKLTIYTLNKTQSTTHNAYGVYDLNGGAWEYVASYVNNGGDNLSTYGGTTVGDLYGADEAEERSTSTSYKTVYPTSYANSSGIKGDAIYETSNSSSSSTGSWFDSSAYFPTANSSFFVRGGNYNNVYAGSFSFSNTNGYDYSYFGFRVVLVL